MRSIGVILFFLCPTVLSSVIHRDKGLKQLDDLSSEDQRSIESPTSIRRGLKKNGQSKKKSFNNGDSVEIGIAKGKKLGKKGKKSGKKGDGDGGVDILESEFVMISYNQTVPVGPSIDISALGTVFIFNDGLFSANLTLIEGFFVSGLCHRTQLSAEVSNGQILAGAGYCFYTFTLTEETSVTTINVAGEVFDEDGGILAVNGCSGDLMGCYGEITIVPVYDEDEDGRDFFTDAALYVTTADIYLD